MKILHQIGIFFIVLLFCACSNPRGNNPGTEYMPDMGHSIAFEANYYDYYYYNTWGSEEEYHRLAQPRKPVEGTIPRGHFGITPGDQASMKLHQGMPINGFVPYAYKDTDEDRAKATAEIIENPYPITTAGMARAKDLYEINCGLCHGKKGDGNGFLVSEDNKNAVYPAQPISFIEGEYLTASNGRYYHAIMHGKNVMGGYGDKLSYEERWQVIHYIRSLQATAAGKVYSETENTLGFGWTLDMFNKNQPTHLAIEDGDHDHHDHGHDNHDHGDHH